MADTPISKTQLRCLTENGWSLQDVAESVIKKEYWHRNCGKNVGTHVRELKVDADHVNYQMVKEFLATKNIVVTGRTWTIVEPKEYVDR